jgi:hypothetical protein
MRFLHQAAKNSCYRGKNFTFRFVDWKKQTTFVTIV